MKRLENIFFAAVLLMCFASCVHDNRGARLLDEAQMQLESSPDSAFVALDSLDRRHLNTKELQARHALLYSIALEKVGIEVMDDSIINIAIDYYGRTGDAELEQEAMRWRETIMTGITPSDTLQIQNARIIKERYADKMTLVENRQRITSVSCLSLLLICGCIIIIRKTRRKLERLPDEETMKVIRERLAVLDKVIASHISSDEKAYRISEKEIEKLMADREEFIVSTTAVFKESHPEFIAHLQRKGLTEWEIGYCCLYTLGLKGKDVGEFIKKKRHYIISSEIRSKLGLGEHDTNIGIYLRNLIAGLEKQGM